MAAPGTLSILLLQGDAEAQLLADAELALQLVFADREVRMVRAWMSRPDWLESDATGVQVREARDRLEQPHTLVILSLLPAVAVRALRHGSGELFLEHRALRAQWSAEQAAANDAACTVQAPLSPQDAAAALEPIVERLQQRGAVVALTTGFRHVREPLQQRYTGDPPTLRERVRRTNLEVAHLSHRTGCFVLDLDRSLAQWGGGPLGADCFGGAAQAAELAVEEFVALIADALPAELVSAEAQ
jgi:hypothetical protein